MNKEADFVATIAVAMDGTQVLIAVSSEHGFISHESFETGPLDESDWSGLPMCPGVYRCACEFWFEQGYFEGYPHDGENCFEYRVIQTKTLALMEADDES